jgi:1,4-dihydroxy-2-naphthoate octaprenyltransferase
MKNIGLKPLVYRYPVEIASIALAHPTEEILTPTDVFNWSIFGFAMLTTLGLQILSNFANDYSDGVRDR